jgi:hypothetical protein
LNNIARRFAIGADLFVPFRPTQGEDMAYVIRSWRASDSPDEEGKYAEIVGGRTGLISFVLSLFGIAPTFAFVVKENTVELSEGTLSGFMEWIIPLRRISSNRYGYSEAPRA